MDAVDVANLQRAVESLNKWDIEPFVQLMAADMLWQGVRTHPRQWRRRPD